MSKCPTCGKTVYFAERTVALGKEYHKLCFKCTTCKKMMEPGKETEHDSKLYCKPCYNSQFRAKGYGFGGGSDVVSSYAGTGAVSQLDKSPMADDHRPSAMKEGSYGKVKFCGGCGEPVVNASAAFCSKCGKGL